jgi:hypothetical protein
MPAAAMSTFTPVEAATTAMETAAAAAVKATTAARTSSARLITASQGPNYNFAIK